MAQDVNKAEIADSDIAQEAGSEVSSTTISRTATKKKSRRKAKKKSSKLRLAKPAIKSSESSTRKRLVRSFPASTFEDALFLGQAIQQFAAGQRVRRLTLFDNIGKSPDSGWSRQVMTNSARYSITIGSHHTEYIELTPEGYAATSPETAPRQQLKARFNLAIENIPPFKDLYEHLKGNKLPAQAVLRDFLVDKGYSQDEVAECVDTFILNTKFLGILRPIAGAERLLPIEHILDEAPATPSSPSTATSIAVPPTSFTAATPVAEHDSSVNDWSKICFYVTPIGAPGSEERQHSDLFLSSIVEPALEEFGLNVVRADQIAQPGLITSQIIEHVVKSRLVVADLSYHNANVFYELCLRHACRLPTVQIIRIGDPIPFDLNQVRTIQIDTTNIFTLVPQLETYKSEIANQVRRALSNPEGVDNPLTMFYPTLGTLQQKKENQ